MTLTTTGRHALNDALRRAVDRLDPVTRSRAGYHLCWTDVDGRPDDSSGGKAVRPALALLSARAVGAPAETGMPGAVAVELVYNFSLLHDDLIDVERRHRPTVWSVWGGSSAILTGDALFALAIEMLLESGSGRGAAAARLLAGAIRELIRGQVQDVSFEVRTNVTVDECLDMARGKTGSLMAASAAIGAVLAGAPSPVVAALNEFGSCLAGRYYEPEPQRPSLAVAAPRLAGALPTRTSSR